MSEDMVLFTRAFDLLAWLLPKSESFPKLYRATLTHRLMRAALDFQEAIFEAHLQEPEAQLQLAEALDIARERSAALLCYEADALHCHRRIVAGRLAQAETFEVEDLRP